MRKIRIGAASLAILLASVLTLSSQAQGQVVEKARTWADLQASHPCASGLSGRITRLLDADSASDIGGGGGSTQVWVQCDGVDTWSIVSIGGAGGGGEATSVQGSATLPATCTELDLYQDTDSGGTEFYVCTATNTWTKAGTGTIGGTLTATDDLAVCTDGTGGSTIGACTVLNLDNLRFDGNTISSTDTNGNINLTPNGTGQVVIGSNDAAATPDLQLGSAATGINGHSSGNYLQFILGGTARAWFTGAFLEMQNGTSITGSGTNYLSGFSKQVSANTSGSGSPAALAGLYSNIAFTNEGSTAENYYALPTALAGVTFTFIVQDADGIRITAAAGDTIRPIAGTAASAAAGFIRCATQGAFITLIAINATEWVAIGSAGVWTIDV